MASTLKHLRSSTADKRPTASGLVDGQLAINTASGTPALFFKDSGGSVVKVGPAHVGSAAPNAVPAGSAGNSLGELWVDNSLTTAGLKYYTGSAFVNLTPSGTTTTVGLVELATPAETQAGTDGIRAVTPSGLQSKVSDSTSTTSSTTIASSTAVKAAYDLADAALPKAGGTVTGELLIGTTGSLVFEGTTDDSFETTLAVVDPTADRTITFPNVTGTVVTTGDSGTVTSTMIANDTIVNADINSAAAIAYSKLALSSGIVNTDISASAAIAFSKLASMTAGNILLGNASNVPTSTAVTGDVTISNAGVTAIASGVIVNADVNASAAIAGTKISPDFGSQNIVTTGTSTAASFIPTSSSVPTNGLYLPAANSVAISTNSTERVEWGASEVVFNDGGENYDFRIEGDTNSSLFFVDASTDRVGIGSTLAGNANNRTLIRSDSASAISNVLLLNNGPADNNAGQGVRINLSGASEATSSVRFAYIESGTATTGNDHYIAFGTNAAFNTPLEAVRIDSARRLLVGTSTDIAAGRPLQVVGTGGGFVYAGNDTASATILLDKYRGTLASPLSVASGDNAGRIVFRGYNSSAGSLQNCAEISAQIDGTPSQSGTDMPGRLVFSTTADGASSPTERMRIANQGDTYHFATTDVLFVASAAVAGTTYELIRGGHTATAVGGGTTSFRVYTNGNVQNTNNSYGAISDIKLKENIVDANSQWDDLKALQVRNYNFKEGQTHTQIGLVAQEVELVSPGLVSESPDRDEEGNDLGTVTKSVNYSVLYMKAVKALQEAMGRIETLEAKVAALEGA